MIREEFEVVVVGAGPAGLASAVTLGSYGVETLVVERRASSSTLPRATVASTATMELLRRWGLEEKAWERSIDVEWRGMGVRDARRRGSRPGGGGGPTDARAGAARQPDLARLPCPGRARAAAGGAPRLVRERGARARRRTRRTGARKRRRPRAHARRPRHAPPRPRQVRDRRRRRAQQRAGGARDPIRAATRTLRNASRSCSGARSGSSSASTATASTSSTGAAASFPPASRTAGCSGWNGTAQADDADALTTEQITHWIRDASGEPDLQIAIERVMPVAFGIGLAERLQRGRRLPHRRRSAPGDSARRHRAQHGDPRRLRHRLEARLGPARLGPRAAARELRARAPACRRVQHGTLLTRRRLDPRHRGRPQRRHRRSHRPRLGAARRPASSRHSTSSATA